MRSRRERRHPRLWLGSRLCNGGGCFLFLFHTTRKCIASHNKKPRATRALVWYIWNSLVFSSCENSLVYLELSCFLLMFSPLAFSLLMCWLHPQACSRKVTIVQGTISSHDNVWRAKDDFFSCDSSLKARKPFPETPGGITLIFYSRTASHDPFLN